MIASLKPLHDLPDRLLPPATEKIGLNLTLAHAHAVGAAL
jgi:hypothetical protein